MIMEFTSGNLLKEINPSVNGKSVEKIFLLGLS